MKSKDFKALALSQLRGKWGRVTGTLLVAGLVTAAAQLLLNMPQYMYNILHDNPISSVQYLTPSLILFYNLAIIAELILSYCVSYGVIRYLLRLVRRGESESELLLSVLEKNENAARVILLGILQTVFVLLWSFLLIIPGIIASYRYAMALYIMADDDKIKPIDAIRISKRMMRGHKWELFCLQLSFIGWILLSVISFGLGFIILRPYMDTALANFYEYLRGIYESRTQI